MSEKINDDFLNRSLDKSQPVYRQVAYALEEMICKDCEVGDYLPSENELAMRFSVNRHTIRRAMDDLVASGFIIRQQGKGSLVMNTQIEYSLNEGRFTASLDKLRLSSTSQVLRSEAIPSTPKVADYLQIEKGEKIIAIETLRRVNNQPTSLITHFMNPKWVPEIEKIYQGGSLHQCVEDHYGIKLIRLSALISATMPTREDAGTLKSILGQPLLKIKSFNALATAQEKMVEVSISRSRSDRFQVKID